MDDANRQRGDDLLLPFGLSVDNVKRIELSRNKFQNLAVAKRWMELHGFGKSNPNVTRDVYVFDVGDQGRFLDETVRTEKINREVAVWAGQLKDFDLDIEVVDVEQIPEITESEEPEVSVQKVAATGELFCIAKQDSEPEAEVRMIGIVSKPEVPDAEGSVISAEEIRQANDRFMREFGTIGFMHQKSISDKVQIIQNVIAPVDIEYPLPGGGVHKIATGTWYQELYSSDPDIVKGVKGGTLNGLSIGGLARRQQVEQSLQVQKREKIAKGDGDPVKERLVDLIVEEVSIVDAAANEEVWLVVKRHPQAEKIERAAEPQEAEMDPKKTEQQATAAPAEQPVEKTAPETTPNATAETASVTKTETTSVAPAPTPAQPQVDFQKLISDAVAQAIAPLAADLAGVKKDLADQAQKVEKSATLVAVAKGDSIPEETEEPTAEEQTEEPSLWAGSSVYSTVQQRRRR